MMPKKLPLKTFLKTLKLVPRVAVSLAIKDSTKRILLAKRLNPPYRNYWHLPGSFLLKGESIKECIKRVLKEELGLTIKNSSFDFVSISEDLEDDPRGHVIDLIYELKLATNLKPKAVGFTKEIGFFKKLPENIGFNHREVLERLGYHNL